MRYPRHHWVFSQLSAISFNIHYKLNITTLGQHSTPCMPWSLSCSILPTPHMCHMSTSNLPHPQRHCQAHTMCTLSINRTGRAVSISIVQCYSRPYYMHLLCSTGYVITFSSLTKFVLSCYHTFYKISLYLLSTAQ